MTVERTGSGGGPGRSLEEERRARLERTKRLLQDTVATLAVEDFRIEDFRFETDSRHGRDLLYLLSNNDWARRTTEVVDVGRVRAVDSEIVVDVDLSFVSHEAFRSDDDLVWLPILALPAQQQVRQRWTGPAGARQQGRVGRAESVIPDAITSLEVHDAGANRVTKVPQGEVHHWLGAVLAETLLPQLRAPVQPQHRADRRDQVVLLAAALRRMLQQSISGSDPQGATGDQPRGLGPLSYGPGHRRFDGRLDAARLALTETFAHDLGQERRGLDSRVSEILDSLLGTVLVVVAVERNPLPTSFRVRLPSRRLVRHQASPLRLRPRARLEIDLLAATTHADRLVRLELPPGVTWLPSADRAGTDVARIEVNPPRPYNQLRSLVRQLVETAGSRVSWVDRRLAELALDKCEAVRESLRYYRSPRPAGDGTADLLDRLALLQERLRLVSRSGGAEEGPPADEAAALRPKQLLAERWEGGDWLLRPLERRLVSNTASPDAVQFRATAIEDFTLRAEPTRARLELDVAVEDSPVLDTARDTNAVNLLLLLVVTGLLVWHRGHREVGLTIDVLATVLTLFPAIQASRIERPDVSTLSGLLTQPGYWLSLATAVPSILLAASLGVLPEQGQVWAAVAATGVQAVLALLIRRPRDAGLDAVRSAPPLTLATDHAPDHRGFEVLRSTWARTLSAEALELGRPAHAEVVLGPDGPGALNDLVEPAAAAGIHLLAVFRACAAGTAMTMLVARENLSRLRLGGSGLFRPVPLELGRLVPPEPPEWIIEVLVGLPRSAERAIPLGRHPLTQLAGAAKDSNFRVLFVQFPSPPPRRSRGREPLVWLRMRIGVPYRRRDTLAKLRDFLTAVREQQDRPEGAEIHMQIVPEMATLQATETAPEENFGGSSARADRRLLDPAEVEVAAAGPGEVWRPFAFCANARTGLVADTLQRLALLRPGLRVAGATSAVVHGVSMTFLLCHDPDPQEPAEGYLGRLLVADLADQHHLAAPIDGRRLGLDRTVDLTADPAAPGPDGRRGGSLLRVQLRTADGTGVLRELLGWVEETVRDQGLRLGIPAERLDVWSALVRVVDGRAVQGRVTVRLPDDEDLARGWESVDWSADAQRSDAILTVDLVRVEREQPADGPGPHSTQTSPAG
jgi:hypothetical protein